MEYLPIYFVLGLILGSMAIVAANQFLGRRDLRQAKKFVTSLNAILENVTFPSKNGQTFRFYVEIHRQFNGGWDYIVRLRDTHPDLVKRFKGNTVAADESLKTAITGGIRALRQVHVRSDWERARDRLDIVTASRLQETHP